MGRHKEAVGGWFRIWGRKWLNDEKLMAIGDEGQAWFLRVLCAANELLNGGVFAFKQGTPMVREQICLNASITDSQFQKLLDAGLVIKNGNRYLIPNWDKWQNPDSIPNKIRDSILKESDSKKEEVRSKNQETRNLKALPPFNKMVGKPEDKTLEKAAEKLAEKLRFK